jgi:UDP-glucose 4-epimerase
MPREPVVHLVRGACGFLGRHLARRLLHHADRLRLFCRHAERLPRELRSHPKVEVVEADALDREQVMASLDGVHRVFDLLGATVPTTSPLGLSLELELNLEPLALLLEAMVQAGASQIVFPSSGGTVYGRGRSQPLLETDPLQPESPYGAGKLLAEEMIRFHARRHGLSYLILRIANTYGRTAPGTSSQGVVDVFLHRILEGLPVDVWGNGEQVRDYLHIDDLADAVDALLAHGVRDDVFNVGSRQGHTVMAVMDLIEQVTGRRLNRRHRSDIDSGIPYNALNIDKIRHATGWQPQISLWAGVGKAWSRLLEERGPGGAVERP